MRVVVLGAGFGGLELTTRLSEEFGDDADVVLIDRTDGFVFGFSKLDVMFGRTTPEAVHHAYADIVKPGVRFVQADVTVDRPGGQAGRDRRRDLRRRRPRRGPRRRPRPVGHARPGRGRATSSTRRPAPSPPPTPSRPSRAAAVVVGVTRPPFKCPPAPSETALLVHDLLVERGLRDRSTIAPGHAHGRPDPTVARGVDGAAGRLRGAWDRVAPGAGRRRRSTRTARSSCWATAPRCRTTSSSASPSTGRPQWSWTPGSPSTAGSRSTR